MARQLSTLLAELTPTLCPAEVMEVRCPWGRRCCVERVDARGLLTDCWEKVLDGHAETDAADQRC